MHRYTLFIINQKCNERYPIHKATLFLQNKIKNQAYTYMRYFMASNLWNINENLMETITRDNIQERAYFKSVIFPS